jgi:hypothetical protein
MEQWEPENLQQQFRLNLADIAWTLGSIASNGDH